MHLHDPFPDFSGYRYLRRSLPSACARIKEIAISKQKKIDIRRAKRAEQDLQFRNALVKAKAQQRKHQETRVKRKPNGFLVRYLGIPLCSNTHIRSEADYRAKSYNLSRQVTGLVDHLIVRYPVPLFLYRSVLSFEGIALIFGDIPTRKSGFRLPEEAQFRDWFLAVARGESFAKLTKNLFTKKEAHLFLQAPDSNSIKENILWAKAAAAGVPVDGCEYLVRRLDAAFQKSIGDRLTDLLRFFANEWKKMRPHVRDQIIDYFRAAAQDQRFTFKGRTLDSVIKLTDDWHRSFRTNALGEYRSWPQSIEPWEHRKSRIAVRAIELTNNRALSDEGQKLRHCVYGYASGCAEGRSEIVSFRWFAVASETETPTVEVERITVEVSMQRRAVVQISGKLNRRATDEEMAIVRLWAGEKGFTIEPWAN